MRRPFDIKYKEGIKSGLYQVVSRTGKPAKIVEFEGGGDTPIIALFDNRGFKSTIRFTNSVRYWLEVGKDSEFDLFVETNEPPLNDYETAVKKLLETTPSANGQDLDDLVRNKYAPELLKLARKEITKKFLRECGRYDYEEDCDLANNAIGMIDVGGFMNNRSRMEVVEWLKKVPKRLLYQLNND